jgi:steroid 5-alpha reductase family enzyme
MHVVAWRALTSFARCPQAVDLAIQWVGWALASLLRTERFYDLTGSLTFVTLALGTLLRGGAAAQPRSQLLTALVCLWAARLGTFLARRVAREGKDSRFDGVRDNPPRFLAFWTVQGVWVFITSLPLLLLNAQPAQAPLRWSDALGACVHACVRLRCDRSELRV